MYVKTDIFIKWDVIQTTDCDIPMNGATEIHQNIKCDVQNEYRPILKKVDRRNKKSGIFGKAMYRCESFTENYTEKSSTRDEMRTTKLTTLL